MPTKPTKPKAAKAVKTVKATAIVRPQPTLLSSSGTFSELRARTGADLLALRTAVETFPLDIALGQDLIHAAGILGAMSRDLDSAWEKIKVAMRSRKAAGGNFEQGKAVIIFKGSERRTPAWKDEATKLAGQIAATEGRPFDVRLYQDQVTAATPAVAAADAVTIVVAD